MAGVYEIKITTYRLKNSVSSQAEMSGMALLIKLIEDATGKTVLPVDTEAPPEDEDDDDDGATED